MDERRKLDILPLKQLAKIENTHWTCSLGLNNEKKQELEDYLNAILEDNRIIIAGTSDIKFMVHSDFNPDNLKRLNEKNLFPALHCSIAHPPDYKKCPRRILGIYYHSQKDDYELVWDEDFHTIIKKWGEGGDCPSKHCKKCTNFYEEINSILTLAEKEVEVLKPYLKP